MRSNKTPRSNHDPHIKIQFASCKLPLLLIKNYKSNCFKHCTVLQLIKSTMYTQTNGGRLLIYKLQQQQQKQPTIAVAYLYLLLFALLQK